MDMDFIYKLLAATLTAVLPIVGGFICDYLHRLAVKARESAEADRVKELVSEIDGAVEAAVLYVNQTFVDTLKKEDNWTDGSGEEAFRMAFDAVIETVSTDALHWVEETFGNVRRYLEVKIEKEVQCASKG